MNRFFIDPSAIAGHKVSLIQDQARQVCRVLRLQAQDRIVALDNTGTEYEVVLTEVSSHQVLGRVVETRQARGEPQVDLTLYQSLLARDKFEHVLQKGTEIGVRRFVPMKTQRSLVRESKPLKQDRLIRWQRILTEAAEQAGRGRVPQLDQPMGLQACAKDVPQFDLALVAWPQARGACLAEQLKTICRGPARLALFVGPEGGFSGSEIEALLVAGANAFSLGPRTMRTETAAAVISALVLYEMGEFKP